MPEGVNGELYFCILVDEFSRFAHVGVLRSKGEAVQWTKTTLESLQHSHKRQGTSITRIRADNGSEITSKSIVRFLDQEGIHLDLTPTYCARLNGLAERTQGTIVSRMRCLILDSNLPDCLWPLALNAAVTRYNLSPHRGIRMQSPVERLHGKEEHQRELEELRIFGSKVLVFPSLSHPLAKSRSSCSPPGELGLYLHHISTSRIEVFVLRSRKVESFDNFLLKEGQHIRRMILRYLVWVQLKNTSTTRMIKKNGN
jgi:hypothetical protein